MSLRAVALVAAAALGQLLLLLWLQRVQTRVYGASDQMDAYLCAYALPLVLGGILAAAAGTAIVPYYQEQERRGGVAAADAAAGRVAGLLLLLGTAFAAAMALGAAPVIRVVYSDLNGDRSVTAIRLLKILCWLTPLTALTGFLYGLWHARQRFQWPALAGLIGPLGTILWLLLAPSPSIDRLAWAVLGGGIVGLMVLLPGAVPGSVLRQSVPRKDLLRFGALAVPIVVGAAYSRLDVIVDRILAARLSEGTISQMAYAARIVSAVATLTTSGLSVVIFPALARHAAAGDLRQLRSDLSEGWRFLAVILIPVIAGLYACGGTIIAALFEHGVFTSRDTAAVDLLIRLSIGFLVGAAVAEVASRTLTALGRVWTVTLVGIIAFTAASATKIAVVDRFSAPGLAATASVSAILVSLTLLALLVLHGGRSDLRRLSITLLRSTLASTVAVGLGAWLMSSRTPGSVAAGIAAAIATYVAILLLLRDEFARRAWLAAYPDRSTR